MAVEVGALRFRTQQFLVNMERHAQVLMSGPIVERDVKGRPRRVVSQLCKGRGIYSYAIRREMRSSFM